MLLITNAWGCRDPAVPQEALDVTVRTRDSHRHGAETRASSGALLEDVVALWLGMKTVWKLSDFSAEKWKRNENTEMETEFCKTKVETETFMWKWKRKRNGVFRRNDHGNGNSVSGNMELSVFYYIVLA